MLSKWRLIKGLYPERHPGSSKRKVINRLGQGTLETRHRNPFKYIQVKKGANERMKAKLMAPK